jgi:hypothetical protein
VNQTTLIEMDETAIKWHGYNFWQAQLKAREDLRSHYVCNGYIRRWIDEGGRLCECVQLGNKPMHLYDF